MSDAIATPVDVKPTQMQGREQQIGYALAGFAAASAIALATAGGGPVALGAVGVGAAAALALASRHGQRIITSFAALFTGFLLVYVPLELVFLLFSGYLMWRTSKAQAKVAAGKPRLSPEQRREAKAARAGDAQTSVSRPRQPTANRRYTPPKAKPGPKR